jgi:hypothetical protein
MLKNKNLSYIFYRKIFFKLSAGIFSFFTFLWQRKVLANINIKNVEWKKLLENRD